MELEISVYALRERMSLVESQPPPRRPSSPVSKSRGQAGRPSRLVSVYSPSGVDSSFPPNLSLPAPLHRAQPPHPGRADICSILRIPATPAVCCAVRKSRLIFHPRGQGSDTKPAQGDQHCGGAAGMRPAKPWPQPRGSAGQTEHTSQKKMRARHVCQPLPGQSHWPHTSESLHQASEGASLGALPPPRLTHLVYSSHPPYSLTLGVVDNFCHGSKMLPRGFYFHYKNIHGSQK